VEIDGRQYSLEILDTAGTVDKNFIISFFFISIFRFSRKNFQQ